MIFKEQYLRELATNLFTIKNPMRLVMNINFVTM